MPPQAGYSYLAAGPSGGSKGNRALSASGAGRSSNRGSVGPWYRWRRRASPSTPSAYVVACPCNDHKRRSSSNTTGMRYLRHPFRPPGSSGERLLLDAGHRDALDDLALADNENDQDRHDRYHRTGHDQREVRGVLAPEQVQDQRQREVYLAAQ